MSVGRGKALVSGRHLIMMMIMIMMTMMMTGMSDEYRGGKALSPCKWSRTAAHAAEATGDRGVSSCKALAGEIHCSWSILHGNTLHRG